MIVDTQFCPVCEADLDDGQDVRVQRCDQCSRIVCCCYINEDDYGVVCDNCCIKGERENDE